MTCQLELATFLMKTRVGGIKPGEHRGLVTMGVAHEQSGLDRADGSGELGVFRVNIDAGHRGQLEPEDPAKRDHVMAHPMYGHLGWVCVVQPGPNARAELHSLLREAYDAARLRWQRRHTV